MMMIDDYDDVVSRCCPCCCRCCRCCGCCGGGRRLCSPFSTTLCLTKLLPDMATSRVLPLRVNSSMLAFTKWWNQVSQTYILRCFYVCISFPSFFGGERETNVGNTLFRMPPFPEGGIYFSW